MFVNAVDETGNAVVSVNFLLLYIVYAQWLLCAVQMSFSNVVSHKLPTRECLLKKQHRGCKCKRHERALNVLHICRLVKSLVYCVVSCVVSCVGICSSDVSPWGVLCTSATILVVKRVVCWMERKSCFKGTLTIIIWAVLLNHPSILPEEANLTVRGDLVSQKSYKNKIQVAVPFRSFHTSSPWHHKHYRLMLEPSKIFINMDG